MHIKLEVAVNKFLTQRAAERSGDRDYSYFHASEWEKCHRRKLYAFYESTGQIKIDKSALKIEPQFERICDNGHYVHDRWRTYLTGTGALMGRWQCVNNEQHETPQIYGANSKYGVLKPKCCACGSTNFLYHEIGLIDDETLWGGHMDAIVDLNLLAKYCQQPLFSYEENIIERLMIVDFKSIKPFSFKAGDKYSFRGLDGPLPDHRTQLQIYMYLTGLKHAKLVYECKGTQSIKEYYIPRDDKFLAEKKREALTLKRIVDRSRRGMSLLLPQRKHTDRRSRECSQCKYRADCWDSRHDKQRTERLQKAAATPTKHSLGDLNV